MEEKRMNGKKEKEKEGGRKTLGRHPNANKEPALRSHLPHARGAT